MLNMKKKWKIKLLKLCVYLDQDKITDSYWGICIKNWQLTEIQLVFIWKDKNPKIKNSTLCNHYENGGLKNVDIFSKVVAYNALG